FLRKDEWRGPQHFYKHVLIRRLWSWVIGIFHRGISVCSSQSGYLISSAPLALPYLHLGPWFMCHLTPQLSQLQHPSFLHIQEESTIELSTSPEGNANSKKKIECALLSLLLSD